VYLFVNTLFNGHLIGSGFTTFGYENYKTICLNVQKIGEITIYPIFERLFQVLNE